VVADTAQREIKARVRDAAGVRACAASLEMGGSAFVTLGRSAEVLSRQYAARLFVRPVPSFHDSSLEFCTLTA
jgi:hypothetical protein